MRLESLRIENFRAFQDTTITFEAYTCLVGQNGAGKSAVLAALNVFFRNPTAPGLQPTALSDEDFFQKQTEKPISIAATFSDLSPEASADFKAYVRQEHLTIKAVATWSQSARTASLRQVGSRLVYREFSPWFDADSSGTKVIELRELYSSLRKKTPDLPDASTKVAMESALHTYEEAHPERCELVDSEDQFYGWSKGENRLRKYIQWVYIPAVKDASTEQLEGKTTALGELLERSIRQKLDFEAPLAALRQEASQKYQVLLDAKQSDLQSLSSTLEGRLQQWSHARARLTLHWNNDPTKSVVVSSPLAKVAVGEGSFVGELCRLGHGLQRSFLVAILQELTQGDGFKSPRLLLGFEEPELYQHPPQAKHLASLLQQLTVDQAQVIVTTHSPYFVSASMLESIRLMRRSASDESSSVASLRTQRLTERLAAALGEQPVAPTVLMASLENILQPSQNELFFCAHPILVEGPEDIAYLATYLKLTERLDAFRSRGGHFVVARGKTNLSRPLAISQELGIPAYVVLDADGEDAHPVRRQKNERDNLCILNLLGIAGASPFPVATIVTDRLTMWPENIHNAVRADYGTDVWDAAQQATREKYDLHTVTGKNPQLILATMEELWRLDKRSSVLDVVTTAILAHMGA
jgi:putative ATP-dependent endonuclease of the OLD family